MVIFKFMTYGQLIFHKIAETIQWGTEYSFQQKVLEQLDIHTQKNKIWTPTLHHTQKLTQNGSST